MNTTFFMAANVMDLYAKWELSPQHLLLLTRVNVLVPLSVHYIVFPFIYQCLENSILGGPLIQFLSKFDNSNGHYTNTYVSLCVYFNSC